MCCLRWSSCNVLQLFLYFDIILLWVTPALHHRNRSHPFCCTAVILEQGLTKLYCLKVGVHLCSVGLNEKVLVLTPVRPLYVFVRPPVSRSDHQQRQQQDEFRRRRASRQSGLSGGGDRERPTRDGGVHRDNLLCFWEMGGSHSGRRQRKERWHGTGQEILHLWGEPWDICQTVTGKYIKNTLILKRQSFPTFNIYCQ